MSVDVVVVDYGVGNLFSVRRAFEHCGAGVLVSSDPATLLASPRLVLPGVGAFADGMRGLVQQGLDRVILEFAASGKPLMGICLGMQLLASASQEFGEHSGLGIVPGRVEPIPVTRLDGTPHKIPHIGWAALARPPFLPDWRGSILEEVQPGEAVYLVHSFAVRPDDEAHRLAVYDYNGRTIAAAIRKENIHGTQFHPEKSAAVGLRVLQRFLSL